MTLTTTEPALPLGATADNGLLIRCCERGWLPDALIRLGMQRLLRRRLHDEGAAHGELRAQRRNRFLDDLRASPIAIATQTANAQHYELPPAFFRAHLGPHLKYSCCLYRTGRETLAQAETAMLELYAERAALADGQRILDLGCGWGSLSLWLAARYPNVQVTALSNSHSQRAFIEARAAESGLRNLSVSTGNIADAEFTGAQLAGGFDRIVSIEMFEHMKNYPLLLAKLARWMSDDAKLFIHIFAHRTLAYHFETLDGSDWISKYFFTGGTMPSEALLLNFQDDVRIERQWWVSGTHYRRTADHWLAALDDSREQVMPLLAKTYGKRDAEIWLQRWRMFYMSVSELFGFAQGNEWGVGHYLFSKRTLAAPRLAS